MELARAAGYVIRPVEAGGVRHVELDGVRLLEVGPLATDAEITRHAAEYIELPAPVIVHVSHVCLTSSAWRL